MLAAVLTACSGMNDLHDKYLENGEIIYTGRVSDATVRAGKGRVVMSCTIPDPNAKNLKIYWNSRTDSVMLELPEKGTVDAVLVEIRELKEGNYYFELFTYNKDMQNRSVVYNASGNVYGSKFQKSLRDRIIKSFVMDQTTRQLTLEWYGAIEKSTGSEIRYTGFSGEQHLLMVPPGETTTILQDVNEEIYYCTEFLPEANAIDPFFTDFRTLVVVGKPHYINDNGSEELPDFTGENY